MGSPFRMNLRLDRKYPPMRAAVTSLLLALFSSSLIAPLLADPAGDIPACCRRDGQHHCGMSDPMTDQGIGQGSSHRALQARHPKCPMFPQAGVAPADSKTIVLSFGPSVAQPELSQCIIGSANEPRPRSTTCDRAQERGPPPSLS